MLCSSTAGAENSSSSAPVKKSGESSLWIFRSRSVLARRFVTVSHLTSLFVPHVPSGDTCCHSNAFVIPNRIKSYFFAFISGLSDLFLKYADINIANT